MDCLRGLDFLCYRQEIDSERLGMWSRSQGGGLTLATAALDLRLKVAVAGVGGDDGDGRPVGDAFGQSCGQIAGVHQGEVAEGVMPVGLALGEDDLVILVAIATDRPSVSLDTSPDIAAVGS